MPALPEGVTRTASTSSTGPGPTRTSATASTTTRSSSTPSRSRRCRGRACSRAATRTALLLLRGMRSWRARQDCRRRTCCSSTRLTRRRARGRLVDAQHGPVPLDQPQPAPYADFADFLASLQREKRKKIQQERRRVGDAGVTFSAASGAAIEAADWDFFYRCYTLTYRAHHSTPYLTRDFFARAAASMRDNWLLFTAWRDGKRIASSLIVIDPDQALPSAATGAPSSTSTACTSTPATTSRWPGASPTATGASRAVRRASTRWRAACCRCRRGRRTGSPIRSSHARSTTSWSAKAPASKTISTS